ncbi:hypothetical protein E0G79_26580 [Salmonella enterica]|nr:hypothetical protein [Salmonella enterica]
MSSLTDAGHVKVYLIIITGILAVTLLLTLIDRKMDDTFPESWFAGLAESFYHVMSIVTTGKTTHKLLFGSAGKIIAAIWIGMWRNYHCLYHIINDKYDDHSQVCAEFAKSSYT